MTKTKKRFENFFETIYYGLIAGDEKKEYLWGYERFFIWVQGIIVLCIWFLSVAYFSTISVSGAIVFQFILGGLFLALLIITEQQSVAWKEWLAACTQPEAKKKQQKESEKRHEILSRQKRFIARLIFCYILISTIICLGAIIL